MDFVPDGQVTTYVRADRAAADFAYRTVVAIDGTCACANRMRP